ncbi:M20 metallopeptidase family protein [Salinicoccus roseus]|uniref:M20 metallopeptidase family protein n=1 Tax=Salinicoccus roseus TaxID=45670 RepID=UPI000F4FB380|nr:amidohydrolase [Salinicoccus roseus]RPE52837.1 amidohydrolase [Salinicoccus roseus]GGA73037.1 amidohydrolase [Salinicoccus roseus]
MDINNFERARELRHELHANPELSNEETWTKQHLMDFLKRHTSLEIINRGTWFYAAYRSGADGLSIAFRADFDALPMDETIDVPWASKFPGKAHKCGHDGHSATLAAFALEIDQKGCSNNIFFLFQPAEETGEGAKQCLPLLKDEDIDRMYGYHNMSGMPYQSINIKDGNLQCASTGMTIRMTGKPAHASTPEDGINPSYSIARLINEIPKLAEASRSLLLATIVNVDIGTRDFGMAAYEGELSLTIRALHEKELEVLKADIITIAHEEAMNRGMKVSFEYSDEFPETVNDSAMADEVRWAAGECGLEVNELQEAIRGSEDFGHYAKEVPAAYFYIGNGENHPPLHTSEYDFIDEHIKTGCNMFEMLANV